jgi:glycosyltransferase involved in cell wall biosynthesis
VLAPSGGYRSHLESRGVARTGIWSRGVDLDQFSPAFRSERYRRELGLGPDDLLVAYVGRIAPEKGIDRLLEAWRVVADRHPRAHLAFTGSGLMEPLIRKEALPRVHLTGVKHGFDLSVAYASADVFAMSSITETFGNVTLEAMASGVPVVGFGAGGTLELGRHEESMLLAPPERTDQFTSQLDRVLGDDSLRRRLAAGALRSAAERSWEPIFDQLLGHYHDVAAAGFASRAA